MRKVNVVFSITSIGYNEVREDKWMLTFEIYDPLYHRTGSLLPVENETPKFIQIYFIGDNATEYDVRSKWNLVDKELISILQKLSHDNNKYVKKFKMAIELVQNIANNVKVVIRDFQLLNVHKQRTYAPCVPEIAAVLSGDETMHSRDIVIESKYYESILSIT